MRILMAAGGTGGHLIPAIRIAEAIARERKDTEFMFVGSDRGFEKDVIGRRGYRYVGLPARGFVRRRIWRNFSGTWNNLRALRQAGRTVDDFAPHTAVGCGGYASYFPVRAARGRRIPYVLQEQNRIPGLATRWLAAGAEVTFLAFEQTASVLGSSATEHMGNPIDPRLATMDRQTARAAWELDDQETVVLVTGGSGGARSINQNVIKALHKSCPGAPVTVLWQTGRQKTDWDDQAAEGWQIRSFEFTDKMTEAFVAADVIISRAGALTISEIAAAAKPAILVPFPHATADHQTHNATALVDAGGAVMIADRDLSDISLLRVACELLQDKQGLIEKATASGTLARPEAAAKIAARVISIAERSVQKELER